MTALLALLLALGSPEDCPARWWRCWSLDSACATGHHDYGAGGCRAARQCFAAWEKDCE